MKTEYQKPYLAVESFQLNAAIAGSCAGLTTLSHGLDTCTLNDGIGVDQSGTTFFGAKCQDDVVNTDNTDAFCYQNFTTKLNDQFVDS